MNPRRIALLVASVAAPWSWFAVRDLTAWTEVAAIGMPLIGAGCLAALLLPRSRRLRLGLVSTIVMVLVATLLPRSPAPLPPPTGETVRIMSVNVTGDNRLAGDALIDAAEADPDVIVVLEANPAAMKRLPELAERYPHSIVNENVYRTTLVVLSKYPLTPIESEALTGRRLRAVTVDAPLSFTLIAAHLRRPWFYNGTSEALPPTRQRLVEDFSEAIRSISGPVVVAGDLNASDRGIGYRTVLEVGGLQDAMRSGWASTTSRKWWPFVLRIDHILVRGLCSEDDQVVPLTGSDHVGVVATVGSC
ncbi:MAG: endonuclease/exonuclease/phosphatase family protein [Acidimicrobiia bacterium]|nr:endonuclease/exonuclease/phosphatase family protein [Acidimicrobiia bacterium]MDH4307768.1 endonuclease/exonuclease/phosphatase family protein [Acidimicrobiia bacterium]MDH5293421.1 endonuclease/exonuclease/phosphatase family protein [Acidimicrobiia bacterium]MDH5521888.1 endonuclease/exonuclease/phosphatase family protein [Acidimicrobiia bacterium]